MYKRNLFLNKIIPFLNKPVIKVITGMRRIGKSSILKLLIENIISEDKLNTDKILYINMESMQWRDLKTDIDLYNFVMKKYEEFSSSRFYLLIDEV